MIKYTTDVLNLEKLSRNSLEQSIFYNLIFHETKKKFDEAAV